MDTIAGHVLTQKSQYTCASARVLCTTHALRASYRARCRIRAVWSATGHRGPVIEDIEPMLGHQTKGAAMMRIFMRKLSPIDHERSSSCRSRGGGLPASMWDTSLHVSLEALMRNVWCMTQERAHQLGAREIAGGSGVSAPTASAARTTHRNVRVGDAYAKRV